MAEGLGKAFKGDKYAFYSAGIEAHGLNPQAVKVMKEIGIDISNNRSKTLDGLSENQFDVIFTVCDHAHEFCPALPGKQKVIHFGFDDPPKLAKGASSIQEALSHYRRVRDEIKRFILSLEERMDEKQ
jgi:arsenate reductase